MVDECLGYQRIAAANLATAIAPTIPAGTREIHMQADTQNIRYTLDGTTPTATNGMILVAGAHQPQVIRLSQSLHAIKFILESGSPNLNLHYFGQSDS
jgi:hypothetical protein